MILFCQLDVTGRTDYEPAARLLVFNILRYVSEYKPPARNRAFYVGESAGLNYLNQAGFLISSYNGQELTPDQILIVGQKGNGVLTDRAEKIDQWLDEGGRILAIGMNDGEANVLTKISMKETEYINSYFEPLKINSPFAGIGPSDVLIRSPRQIPLIMDGGTIIGNGILAATKNETIIMTQLAPWHFNNDKIFHWKMTYRRTSFLLARLLGNMGVRANTPLIERFSNPAGLNQNDLTIQAGWLNGLYLDQPEERDDPYRFFRW